MSEDHLNPGRAGTLFRPTAPVENLRRRAVLARGVRAFFDDRGFCEVATPALSRDVVVDRFVNSIPVDVPKCWIEPDDFAQTRFPNPALAAQNSTRFYLQTSPEFAMKRLLAAGMDAIYQLAPVFRLGDRGAMHNVEFTMLEWYERGVDYEGGRNFLAQLVETAGKKFCEETRTPEPRWLKSRTVQRPFCEVFLEKAGVDPGVCDCLALQNLADERGIPYPDSYAGENAIATLDDWIDLLFTELVQPGLGDDAPTILYDYPGSQSQLARTAESNGRRVARRFEMFVAGIELANGYDELTDPGVLRERFATVTEERRRDGSPELPQESRLLAAMDAGFPASSGCALGFDRFFGVLIGARSIDETMAFPIELA